MPTPEKIPVTSFTAIGQRIAREIVLDAQLAFPVIVGQSLTTPNPAPINVKALWDTGATNCAITKIAVEKLGLFPIDKVQVHHADGMTLQNVYALSLIILPNRLQIPYVRATECKSTASSFDFIIGMEIITAGDFAITNVGGKTTVSFRIPSIKTIDFCKELEQDKNFHANIHKTGRNEPCPCGSGKKYKHCHGA